MFPGQETIDQVENVFVFDWETYNDRVLAVAHAAGLHDVNGPQDSWDRDLTLDERVTQNTVLSFLMVPLEILS